jgi:hypothetical protein
LKVQTLVTLLKKAGIASSIISGRCNLVDSFGGRMMSSPLEGKKVYISEAYYKENAGKNFKESNYKTLIEQVPLINYCSYLQYQLVWTWQNNRQC